MAYLICNETDSMPGRSEDMRLGDCGLPELCLIWLLPGWDAHCSVRSILGTIWRVSICSSNVVRGGAAPTWSIWDITTAGTFNLVITYFLSLPQKYSAESPHPGCVNLSYVICFCRNLSSTVFEIVPITQPGSSSSLSLPCSVSSLSS